MPVQNPITLNQTGTDMDEIQHSDLDFFKELLNSQLEDLLERAERTVGALVQSDGVAADPLDQAAMESDRNYTLRIRDRESRLIRKIKIALAKIEDGSFGLCETCGEQIAVARLKARPVAEHCIQCKTRMEAMEKVAGN
jgi:DnaK suppressor protein